MHDEKIKLTIRDVIYREDELWFFSDQFNSLFKMNIGMGEAELVGMFPNEMYKGTRLYSSMNLVDERIYCIPLNAKSIGVYDINENKFSHILIDKAILECEKKSYYYTGVKVYKKYMFIFPHYCSYIIRINLKNNEIDYVSDWYEEIKTEIVNENYGFFSRWIIEDDENMYAAFKNSNAILELNKETLRSKIYRLGEEKDGYSAICNDEDKFWLLSYSGKYIKSWRRDNNEIHTIKLEKTSKDITGIFLKKAVLFVDEIINLEERMDQVVTLKGKYRCVKKEDDFIHFYDNDKGILTLYDQSRCTKRQIKVLINYKDINIRRLIEEEGYLIETSAINLRNYVDYLK